MGRYELDLLVITPRRVVNLEIKNWSGKLRVQRDQWVQQRRDGSEFAHDNLLSYNRDKLLAVRRYLQHSGVTLPVQRFHQAVVFDNPNLDLDPSLERHPAVLRLDRLSSGVPGTTLKPNEWHETVHDRAFAAAVDAGDGDQLGAIGQPLQIKREFGNAEAVADAAEADEGEFERLHAKKVRTDRGDLKPARGLRRQRIFTSTTSGAAPAEASTLASRRGESQELSRVGDTPPRRARTPRTTATLAALQRSCLP
jgi:Nuclease-related domain